jgi:phosphoglycerate kinase
VGRALTALSRCVCVRARHSVDFNVPISNGEITSTQRIEGALQTINAARAAGARCVVLMSHLGRPGGKAVPELSLRPVATALAKLLEWEVTFVPACVGAEAEAAVASAKDGAVLVSAAAHTCRRCGELA